MGRRSAGPIRSVARLLLAAAVASGVARLLLDAAMVSGVAGLGVVKQDQATAGRSLAAAGDEDRRPLLQIGIFAQVANLSIWPEMEHCVRNVAAAATGPVDLHVALTKESSDLRAQVGKLDGIRSANVRVVINKGADIGEFMQQLQPLHEHRNSYHYDLILKIHSKSSRGDWRYRMLSSLCGDTNQVNAALDMFASRPNLGIVGPFKLIWSWNTSPKDVFGGFCEFGFKYGDMENKMKNTWKVIYPRDDSFPPRDRYLISGGSMFWVRPGPLLSDAFQASIPKFLEMWEDGYVKECETEGCLHMYALERVIPTIYHGRYMLDYDQAPRFPEDNMRY